MLSENKYILYKIIYCFVLHTIHMFNDIDFQNFSALLAIFTTLLSVSFAVSSGYFNSPITISIGLIATASIILHFTMKVDTFVKTVGQIIFTITTLISLFYLTSVFYSGDMFLATFFGLTTVVLLLVSYVSGDETKQIITERRVRLFTILIVLLFVSIAAADTIGTEPTVDTVTVQDTINTTENSGMIQIGTVTYANSNILPINYEPADFTACIVNYKRTSDERRIPDELHVDTGSTELVHGQFTRELQITIPSLDMGELQIHHTEDCSAEQYTEPSILVY